MNSVVNRTGDEIPAQLEGKEIAKAYFGIVSQSIEVLLPDKPTLAKVALAIDEIIERNRIVQWVDNVDVKNKISLEIEDWLFEFTNQNDLELEFETIDEIVERCLSVAMVRRADVK